MALKVAESDCEKMKVLAISVYTLWAFSTKFDNTREFTKVVIFALYLEIFGMNNPADISAVQKVLPHFAKYVSVTYLHKKETALWEGNTK